MATLPATGQTILMSAASVLRELSRVYDDEFQRTRDSTSVITLHKGRMALEKAIQLDRMANELDVVASTGGL